MGCESLTRQLCSNSPRDLEKQKLQLQGFEQEKPCNRRKNQPRQKTDKAKNRQGKTTQTRQTTDKAKNRGKNRQGKIDKESRIYKSKDL